MSNQKIPFLSHFLATRTIPISKKDGTPRPVGVGDVIRRIVLKSIDIYHRQMVLSNCNLQYGNGFSSGCESIVHSIKNLSKNMSTTNHVILALDASNAFNVVDRNITLGIIHDKLPSLYLAAFNTYGSHSYTVMDDLTVPVEQGGSQGCPLAGTFFIIGLSLLVEKISSELKGSGRHAWLMDDGFFCRK